MTARTIGALVILSLSLLLSGNWLLPLMDRDEPRFAEASREMLRRGDYIVPRFNDHYRFDKPPLIYWFQAASYRVMGENAFAARFPSALFMTATALALFLWGRRAGQARAGLHAALMFVTCLQVLVVGRAAVADAPMIFFVTMAIWSGWEMTRPDRPAGWWWWLFYVSLALGFLAKGPVAWLPLGGLWLGRWLRPESFRLTAKASAAGLAVAIGLVGLWGVPALLSTHGEFFKVGIGRHVVARSLDVLDSHGARGIFGYLATLPLYFLTFFVSFLPWGFRVPPVMRGWWPARHRDTFGWYLLVQVAIVFAVFTLVRTKLPHYTLPAFPAIALWLALQSGPSGARRRIALGVAAMVILTAVLTLGVFTAVRDHFLAVNLWDAARAWVKPNTKMAVVEFGEPSLVWQFRRTITNQIEYLSPAQAVSFLEGGSPRLLVVPTDQVTPELRSAATNAVFVRARGREMVHVHRLWDMTAIIRP